MKFPFLYLIFLILTTSTIQLVQATDSLTLEYPYVHYSTKDGLPSNETYCIIQDSRGYIWIGTDRGLVKYDGYEFKTYTTFDGLISNCILALDEDKDGNIWYATLDSKVGYIKDDLESFVEYQYQLRIDSMLMSIDRPGYYFNELSIDKKSTLRLLNNQFGYVSIDSNGNTTSDIEPLHNLRIDIKSFDKTIIYNHLVEADSNVTSQIYYDNKLIYTEYNNGYYTYSNQELVEYNDTLFIYDYNNLLILSKQGEVYKKDKLKDRTQVFDLGGLYIFNVLKDVKQGSHGGVFLSTSPRIENRQRKILDNVYIARVVKDHKGGIWISTVRSGVYYFPSTEHLISNQSIGVNGIIPTKNNGIVINSKRYRNYSFDVHSKDIKKINDLFLEDIDFSKLYQNYIKGVDKLKIYGTRRVGPNNPIKQHAFCISGIQQVEDSTYYYWVPNFLYKKHGSTFSIDWTHNLNYKRLEGFFYINDTLSLYGSQLGLIKKEGENYSPVFLGSEFRKEIRVSNVIYLKEYNKIICSVLGNGIVVLDETLKVTDHITTNNGLVSNSINCLYVDEELKLWIGTNRGISKLEFNEDQFRLTNVLSTSKVLKSPNIHQIFKQDSLLFIGTDNGITLVNVNAWEKTSRKDLPLRITGIKISDERVKPQENYNLAYDQNDFFIEFLGISYNQHGQLNYRYRLKGLSEDWIYTKNRQSTFLQLQPGNYTFNLEVQNEFGDWIALENSPNFKINKPYWKTWWFIGGGVLVGLLIIGGVLYFYISNLKKEKAFVEKEQVLSEELNESRQKALSSQLNPHFVFNSLNSIQNFILTRRTELSSDYLSTFSRLMRFVFENSKKLYVPLTDEMEALRLYLELEQVRHNHKFDFKIQAQDLDGDTIFMPSLLVQPMIENAIWHGLLHKEEDDRLLEVTFKSNQDHLLIEVRDNGVGRGGSQPRPKFIKKQRSSGVELTKQRLDLLSQSTGLKTSFEIVDLFNESDKSCGTLVIITIPNNLIS